MCQPVPANIISGVNVLTRVMDWLTTPYTIILLLREPGVHWSAKLRAVSILLLVSFYILNPLDIIPDFHPLLGWLDDLVIIPLGMMLADKLVPELSVVEAKHRAESGVKKVLFWVLLGIGAMIIFALAALGGIIFIIYKLISG